MKKLQLNVDDVRVETFSVDPAPAAQRGTIRGQESYETQEVFGCTHVDRMCSADCTGIGVECYTNDPVYYACTGGNPCTDQAACTNNQCSNMCPTSAC